MQPMSCTDRCRHQDGYHEGDTRWVGCDEWDDPEKGPVLSSAPGRLDDLAGEQDEAFVVINGKRCGPEATRRFCAQLLNDLDVAEAAVGQLGFRTWSAS